MAEQRKPEDNVDVYELGHYETMQLGLALQYLIDVMGDDWEQNCLNYPYDEAVANYKKLYGNMDLEFFKTIRHVFAQDGKVMIIRGNGPF